MINPILDLDTLPRVINLILDLSTLPRAINPISACLFFTNRLRTKKKYAEHHLILDEVICNLLFAGCAVRGFSVLCVLEEI